MRDLLRDYADQGATVLLSSHLLHEIEVIADDLVVIGNGRIVAQGTKTELLSAAGTLVRTADIARPRRRPHRVRRDLHARAPRPAATTPCGSRPSPSSWAGWPTSPACALIELRAAEGAGLEEMFLELTADTQREGAAA